MGPSKSRVDKILLCNRRVFQACDRKQKSASCKHKIENIWYKRILYLLHIGMYMYIHAYIHRYT